MYIYDRWLFKIPVYFTVDYISRHLLAETNFVREARNGERMRQYIEGEPLLRDKVLIPKVYPEILSPRVMVADVRLIISNSNLQWIDGERITKRNEIEEMGFSMRQVMTTMVDLFSAQVCSCLNRLTIDI
jgi:aarF domain-containing kinase